MFNIRKEERLLYAKCKLLKSLSNNEKIKKQKSFEITKKMNEVKKKQLFFHNYLIANDKVRKGEN